MVPSFFSILIFIAILRHLNPSFNHPENVIRTFCCCYNILVCNFPCYTVLHICQKVTHAVFSSYTEFPGVVKLSKEGKCCQAVHIKQCC